MLGIHGETHVIDKEIVDGCPQLNTTFGLRQFAQRLHQFGEDTLRRPVVQIVNLHRLAGAEERVDQSRAGTTNERSRLGIGNVVPWSAGRLYDGHGLIFRSFLVGHIDLRVTFGFGPLHTVEYALGVRLHGTVGVQHELFEQHPRFFPVDLRQRFQREKFLLAALTLAERKQRTLFDKLPEFDDCIRPHDPPERLENGFLFVE